jgi:hypothetical protein
VRRSWQGRVDGRGLGSIRGVGWIGQGMEGLWSGRSEYDGVCEISSLLEGRTCDCQRELYKC